MKRTKHNRNTVLICCSLALGMTLGFFVTTLRADELSGIPLERRSFVQLTGVAAVLIKAPDAEADDFYLAQSQRDPWASWARQLVKDADDRCLESSRQIISQQLSNSTSPLSLRLDKLHEKGKKIARIKIETRIVTRGTDEEKYNPPSFGIYSAVNEGALELQADSELVLSANGPATCLNPGEKEINEGVVSSQQYWN